MSAPPSLQREDANVGTPVIRVRNLCKGYGGKPVLRDITLDIRAGEIMVIMGGSGSGKSTFLRQIMALESPDTGEVEILGHVLANSDLQTLFALRRQMGVAFQGGALLSSLTVGENVMLPLVEHSKLAPSIRQIMARLMLEVVGLADAFSLMPSQLSGGMLKRAAFARAMIMDPKLLYCDEPSAGLDPVASAALDQLILKLRDALGITIVVVTHELDSAFRIADRITFLDHGEILLCGTVSQVRQSDNPRIQNLISRNAEATPFETTDYLWRLTGRAPSVHSQPPAKEAARDNHAK